MAVFAVNGDRFDTVGFGLVKVKKHFGAVAGHSRTVKELDVFQKLEILVFWFKIADRGLNINPVLSVAGDDALRVDEFDQF